MAGILMEWRMEWLLLGSVGGAEKEELRQGEDRLPVQEAEPHPQYQGRTEKPHKPRFQPGKLTLVPPAWPQKCGTVGGRHQDRMPSD